MPKKGDGVIPVVYVPGIGIVSHFRLVASFFVVDVRILPLATRKSTRRASAAARKLSNERYGGRWRSTNSSNNVFDSVFNTPRNHFRPAFRSTCSHKNCSLLVFYETKQQIMQMQILICNPTSHVTQSLITRNVCRRFERIVLTIR